MITPCPFSFLIYFVCIILMIVWTCCETVKHTCIYAKLINKKKLVWFLSGWQWNSAQVKGGGSCHGDTEWLLQWYRLNEKSRKCIVLCVMVDENNLCLSSADERIFLLNVCVCVCLCVHACVCIDTCQPMYVDVNQIMTSLICSFHLSVCWLNKNMCSH